LPTEVEADSGYLDSVERTIRDAIGRGEFDNLPGAGKPLPDLDRQYDPDWWSRRYLEQLKAEDAADEVRRLIRRELPFLRTKPDRAAARARVDELNVLITRVNASIPAEHRIDPITL